MKIACLIGQYPPSVFYLNRIHAEYPVAMAVVQEFDKDSQGVWKRIREKGVSHGVDLAKAKIRKVLRMPKDFSPYFGDLWQVPDETIPCLKTKDVNSEEVFERLKEIEPDLLLVQSTSIVRERVVETAKLALNFHLGLAPYYRGMYCTQWALLNSDPYNIGVTVHKVTQEIDGGDIVAQKRVEVKPDDRVLSINMRIFQEGTDLVLAVLKKMKNGEELEFVEQELALGKLKYIRQFTPDMAREIKRIEKKGSIGVMLERPSRLERLPIVELKR